MKKTLTTIAAVTIMFSSTVASARLTALPLSAAPVTVRYDKSVPTLQIDDANATVNVTSMADDHGRLTFAVAAFNKSNAAFNFGNESVKVTLADGTPLYVLTKDDMVRKANNRAMWAQIAIGVAGGLAAASAASYAGQHSYHSTLYSPYGTYHYSGTYVNYTERALATGAASASTGYALGTIQNDLDHVVANLGQNVLQTTTVDPGTAYGGMVVIDKVKLAKGVKGDVRDQNLIITVNAGGHTYPFVYDLN